MSDETQQAAPAATQSAPQTPESPTVSTVISDFKSRLARLSPKAAPQAAEKPQAAKAKAVENAPVPGIDAESAALLREFKADRDRKDASERIGYARKAGLKPGISDDVARSLVGSFDVSTAAGRNAFEAFRKANADMFTRQVDAAAKADEMKQKHAAQQGKKDPKMFGSKFAARQIERNFGRSK
jgi:hypothetical protein